MRIAMGLLLLCVGLPLRAAPALEIVRDGQPAAAVVVDAGAPAQVREAAQLLVAYVEQSTGARLTIGAEPQPNLIAIHVGDSARVKQFGLKQDDLHDDGFEDCLVRCWSGKMSFEHDFDQIR